MVGRPSGRVTGEFHGGKGRYVVDVKILSSFRDTRVYSGLERPGGTRMTSYCSIWSTGDSPGRPKFSETVQRIPEEPSS